MTHTCTGNPLVQTTVYAWNHREVSAHVHTNINTLNKETFCGKSLMMPSSIFRERTIPGAPLLSLAQPHIKPLTGIITITHHLFCVCVNKNVDKCGCALSLHTQEDVYCFINTSGQTVNVKSLPFSFSRKQQNWPEAEEKKANLKSPKHAETGFKKVDIDTVFFRSFHIEELWTVNILPVDISLNNLTLEK